MFVGWKLHTSFTESMKVDPPSTQEILVGVQTNAYITPFFLGTCRVYRKLILRDEVAGDSGLHVYSDTMEMCYQQSMGLHRQNC